MNEINSLYAYGMQSALGRARAVYGDNAKIIAMEGYNVMEALREAYRNPSESRRFFGIFGEPLVESPVSLHGSENRNPKGQKSKGLVGKLTSAIASRLGV